MHDPRLTKLAQILVNYSTGVKPGELVRIHGPMIAEPLIVEIYRAIIEAGGHPFVQMLPEACREIMLKQGTDEQLGFQSPLQLYEVEKIDVSIGLFGQENSKALSNTDPARQAIASQARKKYFDLFLKRSAAEELRWVGSQFPCQSSAQDAEMSLSEYADFVFRGCFLDHDDPVAMWQDLSKRQQKLTDYLNDKKDIRFVTPQGTDLVVSTEGRTWLNSDGKKNFPDGEVFSGPLETFTEGTVCYSFPAVHGGRESSDVRLVFKEGKVVEASASKNEEFLLSMLDQDAGARILGEIAIGTNYAIKQFTKNTLFDEKIGGTFHAAVGASYPETGGTNQSGLHWDMVCDLRLGGQIFADGELFSENGKFLNPEFPQPLDS